MKLSKNFSTEEFIHPDIIMKLGDIRASNLVNVYLIKSVQTIRDRFGPTTINGSFGGKEFINSGLRKANFYKNWTGTIKESYSTHLWGNTSDLKFKEVTPIEVYEYILADHNKFPFIVRMENAHKTKTWLHIECGKFRNGSIIEVFNP